MNGAINIAAVPGLRQQNKNTRGSALLMAMFCIALVSLAVAGMSQMIKGQVQMNKTMVNNAKAREVANGALEQALAMLSMQQLDANITSLPTALTSGSLGEGAYTVKVTAMDYGLTEVKSLGTVNGITEQIKIFIRKPNTGQAFKKGMFTNGSLDISGSGTAKAGTHSNGNSRIWGSVDMWNGDADSSGAMAVGGSTNLHGGEATADAPKITMPQLNFDYYYQIALANGQIRNGNQLLSGNLAPPGGIIWVNGDVTVDCKIAGSIFATGNIYTKQCTVTPLDKVKTPALATKNGMVDFSGCGNGGGLNGYIWAQTGIVDWHGNAQVYGGVIANGDILCRGDWGVLDVFMLDPEVNGDPRVRLLAYEE